MRRLLNSGEIRTIQLDILGRIDRFCTENGIRYFLAYGSAIGAVRHHGFIPWDDDIDLMMPRPDYERFLSGFRDETLYLLDLAGRDDCIETFVKVCRKGTVLTDRVFGREIWGVNVDVFPIDGAPAEGLEAHYARTDALRNRAIRICPYFKSAKKGRTGLFFRHILKRVRYPYLRSFRSMKRELVRTQRAVPFDSAEVAGVFYAAEKTRTFFGRALYENSTRLPFEGREYPLVGDYDRYLTQLYGDYMQLPPEERRTTHHNYDSYQIENDEL